MNPVFAPDEPLVEWRGWPPTWKLPKRLRWPGDVRKFMFWIFATTSLLFLADVLYTIPRHYKLSILLAGPIFNIHVAVISGAAAWTIWKGKSWARGWAIAASLMYILIFPRQFIIHMRPAWDHRAGALFQNELVADHFPSGTEGWLGAVGSSLVAPLLWMLVVPHVAKNPDYTQSPAIEWSIR